MNASFSRTVFTFSPGTAVLVGIDDKPKLQVHGNLFAMESYTIEPSAPSVCLSRIRFMDDAAPICIVEVDDKVADDFDRWFKEAFSAPKLKGQQFTSIIIDEVECPECPECYGTGFFKGFGGPCSKGCK